MNPNHTSALAGKNLMKILKNFDWWYAYSDDHRVWQRGRKAEFELKNRLAALNCPYTISELRMATSEMVVEDFEEDENGYWYRQPRKYKNVAGVRREDLMHRADQVQVLAWVEIQE